MCRAAVTPTGLSRALGPGTSRAVDHPMKDLLFVAVSGAFFALAWIYTKSFDRL
jgi:hypothetical protein